MQEPKYCSKEHEIACLRAEKAWLEAQAKASAAYTKFRNLSRESLKAKAAWRKLVGN